MREMIKVWIVCFHGLILSHYSILAPEYNKIKWDIIVEEWHDSLQLQIPVASHETATCEAVALKHWIINSTELGSLREGKHMRKTVQVLQLAA